MAACGGLLALLYISLYAIFGSGSVLARVPWITPMAFTFLAVTSLSVAFLAFGRHQVLRSPPSFWVGIAFLGFAIGAVFYVLTWPGLMPGGRSIIARLPNTPAFMSALVSSVLGLLLLRAAVSDLPGGRRTGGRQRPWLLAIWLPLITSGFLLAVLLETHLPALVTDDGRFTHLLWVWNAALLALFAGGAALSFRCYRRSGDALLGYVALFQVAFIFSSLSILLGQQRYDLWWYLNRVVLVGGSLIVLFGLLSDYGHLFRREQEKGLQLRAQEENLRRLNRELERRNAEIEAERRRERETAARLLLATEATQFGTFDLDLATGELVWSEITKRHFGLSPDAHVDYDVFMKGLHPDDRERVHRLAQEAMHPGGGGRYHVEYRTIGLEDGRERWLEAEGQVLFDEHGVAVRLVGGTREVTASRLAERELQRSEERYRTLFDSIDEGYCIIEMRIEPGRPLDYRFLEVNEAFERQSTLVGAKGRWMRELRPEHEESWFEIYRDVALTGEPVRFEHGGRALGDRWFTLYAFRIGAPELRRVAVLFNDITDRKRAEESLRELTATLEAKVAQRTADLAHRTRQLQKLTLELTQAEDRERRRLAVLLHEDLQQQLAATKFHLSRLIGRLKADPALQEAAIQLDAMLGDAIEKSRSLTHELSPAVLYHSDLAHGMRWLAERMRGKHGMSVHVRTDHQVEPRSDALKIFLYRAAQELLSNVIKHAGVSEARLSLLHRRGCFYLLVADQGRGFDPQNLRTSAGFGLLSLRERVQLLGGTMRVKSTAGRGTRFIIALPDRGRARNAAAAAAVPDGETVTWPAGRSLRVLLVDDHEIVRQGLAALLSEEPDLEVVGEAADGREAVAEAYRLRPDVIIMEVSLPLLNGEEATRQIKLGMPRTRIVALSMFQETEAAGRMLAAGAEGYVLKTDPSAILLTAIRSPGEIPAADD